ncbi:MAG: protein translocase subunit SecF [Candidatus Gracilibacteria bacterium]|nr:protein translocase subunit SecF [Candidatus Gracilibacteria bacterium]
MDVLKNRYIYLSISGFFFIISVFMLIFGKLNLAIDMTGGINMEYTYENSVDINSIRTALDQEKETILFENKQVINNVGVYSITGEKAFSIVAGFDSSLNETDLNKLKLQFKNKTFEVLKQMDSSIVETKYTNIGKSFGDYIRNTAFLTLFLAIIAITIYVTYAFSGVVSGVSVISFAIITLVTLFHDVIISAGLYIIAGYFFKDFQIDTFFVTALLTILGYSINDTIVIFDRIRDNLKKFAGRGPKNGKDLYEIINLSINETLKRSIYTSLTLFLVLLTIFIFGPESIAGFILAMMFGTIIGTYSSIFIASPVLYEVNKNRKLSVYKKEVINQDDKIVV